MCACERVSVCAFIGLEQQRPDIPPLEVLRNCSYGLPITHQINKLMFHRRSAVLLRALDTVHILLANIISLLKNLQVRRQK